MRGRAAVCSIALLLVACSSDTDQAPNDGRPNDGTADAGTLDSGSLPDGDAFCAGAPAYKGDTAWSYGATVEQSAHYCVLNAGATLWDRLQQKAELRFVPGRYPLPDEQGDFTLTLPLCLMRGEPTANAAGDGSLTVVFEAFLGDTMKTLTYRQPLRLDDQPLTLECSWRVHQTTGRPNPQLILDDALFHGNGPDTAARYTLCAAQGCQRPSELFRCGPTDLRTTSVTFDRGSATFSVSVIEGIPGPSVPAGLWQAEGTLDGTAFTQTDYYQLAHHPDHHNRNGGFIVRFDQSIGTACGLEIHVPSTDGSILYEQLEGWTIDCSGNQLEALDGLAVAR